MPFKLASDAQGVQTVAFESEPVAERLMPAAAIGFQGNETAVAENAAIKPVMKAEEEAAVAVNPPAVPSVQADVTDLTVQGYVLTALSSHPKIAAARQRVAAARSRVPQARALADPTFSETFWPFNGNALETAGGQAVSQLSLSQAVPWPEKLSAKEAIAYREVQIAAQEIRRVELEISEAVQLACLEVYYADRGLHIVKESRSWVEQLLDVTEARYRSGGSQQDFLRAELELDRLDEQRVKLQQQKSVAQADLASLIFQPQRTDLEVEHVAQALDAQSQLAELIGIAEQFNPELRGLSAQIGRDQAKQRLACLQKFPDFKLGMNWLIISDDDAISPAATGNDNFGFTVGMTLPVWREKIAAGIRESNHQTAATSNMMAAERDSISGRIRRLLAQLDSVKEQQSIYRDRIIPRTEDMLEISLAEYRGQKADFFSVVETYRELLQLELQVVRLDASLSATLARLERLTGTAIIQ